MWLCMSGCARHLLLWFVYGVYGVAYWLRVYNRGNVGEGGCAGSQLRPNRWRERACEQKVSNMEELIVLLNVSLQFFFV